MAIENFTTYDETDPSGYITVIAAKVSWDTMLRDNACHVSDSKGVAFFSGDFTHKFEILFDGLQLSPLAAWYMLANSQLDIKALESASADTNMFYHYQDDMRMGAMEGGSYNVDEYVSADLNTLHFITLSRDDDAGVNNTGQLVARVCTVNYFGEAGSVLKDTLTVDCSAGEQNDFEYVFAVANYDTGFTNSWSDGYTQNLDLDPAVGGTTPKGPLHHPLWGPLAGPLFCLFGIIVMLIKRLI